MKFKRLSILLATAALVLSLGVFAACGTQDNSGEKLTYTVTVLAPDGKPQKGLSVKWSASKTSFKTLEDGTAHADFPSGEYEISVEDFLPIYKYTPVKATAEDRNKTITLEWNPEDGKVVYTVKVVYPNGDPVEGVKLGLCVNGGSCSPFPDATNEKGEAYSMGVMDEKFEIYMRGMDPQEYEVQIISGIPDGYEVELNAENHYAGDKATADKHTVTVTLKEKA